VQEAGFIPFLSGLNAIDTYGLCNARWLICRDRAIGLDARSRGIRRSRRAVHPLAEADVIVVGPVTDWARAPQRFWEPTFSPPRRRPGMNVFRREDTTLVR